MAGILRWGHEEGLYMSISAVGSAPVSPISSEKAEGPGPGSRWGRGRRGRKGQRSSGSGSRYGYCAR